MKEVLRSHRRFQMWYYDCSHGRLIFRSPIGPGAESSIDVVFGRTQWISGPTHYPQLRILHCGDADALGFPDSDLYELRATDGSGAMGERGRVVAGMLSIETGAWDIRQLPRAFGPIPHWAQPAFPNGIGPACGL